MNKTIENNTNNINNINNINDAKNGMFTSIWGNAMWNSLHCISFTYPENPSNDDKYNYKIYFETVKYVLPCCVCRKHYTEHTQQGGDFELSDRIFENKKSLTKWVYELHKAVDESLGVNYDITYDDLCLKYESYVARCNVTQEDKTFAYKNFYNNEAPIIKYETALLFNDYAIERGLIDFKKILDDTFKKFNNKRQTDNKISDDWIIRNEKCNTLLKHMRLNQIMGFETNEKYHNLPTIEELQMFQLMSSSLSDKTLNHMAKKLQEINKEKHSDNFDDNSNDNSNDNFDDKLNEIDNILKNFLKLYD